MSRSNYDKPFYVDVGTSIVAIRCASNSDVIFRYDHIKCPQVIKFVEYDCDRMNKEVELIRQTRNCDIGTPEEQSARFDAHCRKHIGCLTCSLREKDGGVPKHCEFAWAQMPYEDEQEEKKIEREVKE